MTSTNVSQDVYHVPDRCKLPGRVSPNEIRGEVQRAEATPDRRFYVLEVGSQRDVVWEVDGYAIADPVTGRTQWKLHLLCPRCRKLLTIDSTKKSIDVTEPGLEVESFACSWPGDFGSHICGFEAGVRLPRSSSERFVAVDGNPRPRKIDGVFVTSKR